MSELRWDGMYANNRAQRVNNTYRRHQSTELALGYFGHNNEYHTRYSLAMVPDADTRRIPFSVFSFLQTLSELPKGGYHKYFIQPTFAFRPKRFFLAVTLRVTY